MTHHVKKQNKWAYDPKDPGKKKKWDIILERAHALTQVEFLSYHVPILELMLAVAIEDEKQNLKQTRW